MKIISGNSNLELSTEIAKYANTSLSTAHMTRFSDKEIFVEIDENVRGEDVFLVQSTSFPGMLTKPKTIINCWNKISDARQHHKKSKLSCRAYIF